MFSIVRNLKSKVPEKGGRQSANRCRLFATIALIGPDGSGKTSIAKAVCESSPFPIKYIYMGANIDSSNIALPTSRLIHKWKVRRYRKSTNFSGEKESGPVSMHGLEHRIDRHGMLWGGARLLRRVSEEVYRQIVSYLYQLRGYVVLYDRHFLFDATRSPDDLRQQRFTDRLHSWFLLNLYPCPGMVVMLDAPVDVLYSRKQEVPPDYLKNNRRALAKKGCYAKTFVTIDTNRPFGEVVKVVRAIIEDYCTGMVDDPNRQLSVEEKTGVN